MELYNEDCLTGMKRLADNSVDCIICDLPYNLTDCAWDKSAIDLPTMFVHAKNAPMRKYEEILVFSDGVINHATVSNRRMKYNPQGIIPCAIEKPPDGKDKPSQLRAGGRGSKWIHNIDKVSAVSLQGGKLKGNVKTGKNATKTQIHNPHPENIYIQEQTGYPSDVLEFNAMPNTQRQHPTQKPVDLLEYLIKAYTNAGELVLDATMGSGSTGVAAVNTGRDFIGFELEKNFYDIACRRIAEAQAKQEQNLFKDVAT